MQPKLAELMAVVSGLLPRLQGRISGSDEGQLCCGSPDNPQRLRAYYERLRDANPLAGPHYWRIHTWNQIIWQPIYLSVISAHLGQGVPLLDGIGQNYRGDYVSGYSLPPHQHHAGSEGERVDFAAGQLSDWLTVQLQELGGVFKFNPKLASWLALDCLGSALLFVRRPLGADKARLRVMERQWLDVLAVDADSALVDKPSDQGTGELTLERRACCQYFRRPELGLCPNCPRQRLGQVHTQLPSQLLYCSTGG